MKIKMDGHARIIEDHEWPKYQRIGYSRVMEAPKPQVASVDSPKVESAPKALETPDMTKAEIMAKLDKKKIAYTPRSSKAELLELLNHA